MSSAGEIVRAAVPDATDDFISYVLWERTPYPVGAVTAQQLYKAASGAARAYRNGILLCYFCHNKLEAPDKLVCSTCKKVVERAHDMGANIP